MASSSLHKLKEYLDNGFQIARRPFTDYPSPAKYDVPVHNFDTGEKIMFGFEDEDTYYFAVQTFEAKLSNPSLKPIFKCRIQKEIHESLENIIPQITNILADNGFQVKRMSIESGDFEVECGGYSAENGYLAKQQELHTLFQGISLNAQRGIWIVKTEVAKIYDFSPAYVRSVSQVLTTKPFKTELPTHLCSNLLDDLYSFFQQTEEKGRVIFGWIVLEKHFCNDEQLIDKDQKNTLCKAISDAGLFEDVTNTRLAELIKGRKYGKYPVDESIAANLNESGVIATKEDIKFIRQVRGDIAHRNNSKLDTSAALKKMDEIFKKLIEK